MRLEDGPEKTAQHKFHELIRFRQTILLEIFNQEPFMASREDLQPGEARKL